MVSSRIQVPSWSILDSCLFLTGWTLLLPSVLWSSMRFFSRAHSSPVGYLPGAHLQWVNTCLSPPALTTLFPSDVCQHHPETSDSSDNFSIARGIIRQWVRWRGGCHHLSLFPREGDWEALQAKVFQGRCPGTLQAQKSQLAWESASEVVKWGF